MQRPLLLPATLQPVPQYEFFGICIPTLPLVGVEPAIKPAVLATGHAKVVVMATPMTLREEKFHKLESLYDEQADIYPLPCPGLMEFVEQGILSGEKLETFLHNLLDPYKD